MIDIHCHLTFKDYDRDRDDVIKDAEKALKAVIISGVEPKDAEKALNLKSKYPNFIHVSLGLHPIHVSELSDTQIDDYVHFIRKNKEKIVGIGEVGLDYHWIKSQNEVIRTKNVFKKFLGLAEDLDLPVILHFRNALEDGFKIVLDNKVEKAVFHCFTGKRKLAYEIAKKGYYISVAPNIIKSKDIKKAVKDIPLEKILTETDSPFLAPDNRRNVPQNVKIVIEKIAEIKKASFFEVGEKTVKNAVEVFNLNINL
ncbi:MAG: TatD family hydrolase [Candidatus Bathyarchaeota archaeon]